MKELERCKGWNDTSWWWNTESEREPFDNPGGPWVDGKGMLIPGSERCSYVATPGDAFCPRHRFLCDNTPLDTRTDDQKAEDDFLRGDAHL